MVRSLAATLSALTLFLASACDSTDNKARPDLKAGKAAKAESPKEAPAPAPAPAGRVFFISPKDGATVPTKFAVAMGVEGKTVLAAGATVRDPLKGHHHIVIDGGPIADMKVVPKDDKNLHYGDGSAKTTLLLSPGKHTLTMQFADGAHRSYGADWSATITVNVAEGDAPAGGAKAGEAKADG